MFVDRRDQSINSEKFRSSIAEVSISPISRAHNQRETNHDNQRERKESQKIFIPAVQNLRSRISISFISPRLMIARQIEKDYIMNITIYNDYDYPKIIRSADQRYNQPKKEINYA